MAQGDRFKTPENIERFVTMVLLGCDRVDIQNEIGIKRATYYVWMNDPIIIAELDSRRAEIKDQGLAFIKGRYKRYLENIDKLCNDTTDRRTCLAANQFMVEKMDGKNTAKLEVSDNKEDTNQVDVLENIDKFMEEEESSLRIVR
ncbi:hypothetical protein [Desulfosporosinus youngiae]|uniref:Homeodomain phBC6A51-type domain-containing protein n=1 Tax=Desulfosporosinus youngiae DSM 17734 TaxID=768710 RepID=H5Y576_9FIRM|nr:hypothetical protein [Desulfosporosinus youngiae]EHQ90180.1 hypothetical protein DesyoDRAFT_3146 [Desulfosporosinus youngiae DSM 17734]